MAASVSSTFQASNGSSRSSRKKKQPWSDEEDNTESTSMNSNSTVNTVSHKRKRRRIEHYFGDNTNSATSTTQSSAIDSEECKSQPSTRGKVRIGSKKRRGVKGDKNPTFGNYKNIDVTSGSMNKVDGKTVKQDLSPFYIGPVTDTHYETGQILECNLFENYWQYSKLWLKANHFSIPHSQSSQNVSINDYRVDKKWYQFRAKGFASNKGKRHPLNRRQYGNPSFAIYNGRRYDYVTSRKEIYIPIYRRLVENSDAIKGLRKMVDDGMDIMILDGDGPPKSLYPDGHEITVEFWNQMVDDPKYQFGHGYVVAALVANLPVF